jgi:hypothetical protein
MRKLQAATLIALTLVAACSSSKTGPSAQLTDASAQTVGAAIADQIALTATSFTVTGVSQPLLFAPSMVRPAGAPPMRVNGPCPVVSSTTDTDGDGVPDDATYSYTGLPDCGYSDSTGSAELTGSVRITDPSTTQVGYNATLTNLLLSSTGSGYSFSIKLNGTQNVLGDAANVTLSHHLTTDLSATGNNQNVTGRLDENWNVAFAAAQGSAVAMDSPLPSGTFNVNGSFSYNVNGESFSFSVATQTALQYDASCQSSYQFSSGELRATVNSNSGNAYIQIQYTGCGVTPTVTLVASNA